MSHWEEMQDANQTTFAPSRSFGGGKSQEQNGWIKREVRFKEHKRHSKVYSDATAKLTIEAHFEKQKAYWEPLYQGEKLAGLIAPR